MLLSVGKKAVDENLRVSSGVAESVDDVLRAAETEEVRQVHRRGLDQIGDPCIVEVRHDAETSGNELGSITCGQQPYCGHSWLSKPS
ncbi:hypothetical protein [Nocardioides sp. AN3]